MIGVISRRLFLRHQIHRDFSTKPLKFLREKQLRNESRLLTIKEIVLKENIETNGNINWQRIVSQLAEQRIVNKINFEVDLMSAFILNETDPHIDKNLFESMVKFIKCSPNMANNSMVTTHYSHFISHFNQYIEDSDIQMIRRSTDLLIAKYMDNRLTIDVLTPSLIGLSKSSKDNCLHSIELLDQMKTIDYKLIQQIMDSALNFKLINQTLSLIEKYSEIRLNEIIISKIIDSLSEFNPSAYQMTKLLQTFSERQIVFDSHLMSKILKIMERLSHKMDVTSIGQNGLCLKCDQRLTGVTAEEQHHLIQDFYSVVFNRENDLLLKSFPEFKRELKFFDKFMQRITCERPLDLVIDGLNLAFYINPIIVEDKKNLRKYIQKHPVDNIDTNIVEMLTKSEIENFQNILIVGRNHMKSWKKLNQLLDRQRERISMFYAMNKTQDDCYILYAALQNTNTYLISSDFYRDYCEKMSKKGMLFERWLKTHQISILRKSKRLVFPDRYDHKIHISKDNKTLHIPFHSNDSLKIDWFCCQKY